MKPERLTTNLAQTLSDMELQTNLKPGGPTGQCHNVIVGALTGERMRFVTWDSRYEQIDLERTLGLIKYTVFSKRNRVMPDVIPSVLEQRKISLDAVVIRGTVNGIDKDHIIAVIPENNAPPYHVIDSVLPGATSIFESPKEVITLINKRFKAETLELYVVPDETKKDKNSGTHINYETVRIADDLYVNVPHVIPYK